MNKKRLSKRWYLHGILKISARQFSERHENMEKSISRKYRCRRRRHGKANSKTSIQVKSEFHWSGNICLKAIWKVIASHKSCSFIFNHVWKAANRQWKNGVFFSLLLFHSLCIFIRLLKRKTVSVCVCVLFSIPFR